MNKLILKLAEMQMNNQNKQKIQQTELVLPPFKPYMGLDLPLLPHPSPYKNFSKTPESFKTISKSILEILYSINLGTRSVF